MVNFVVELWGRGRTLDECEPLGLGAMQINAGLTRLFGAPEGAMVQVIAIAVMLSISVTLTLVALIALPGVFVFGHRLRLLIFPISWIVHRFG